MKRKRINENDIRQLIQTPTYDEIMRHIVYCPECNPTYSAIMTHAKKQKMLWFISDNNVDKRSRHYKWAKGDLRI